MTYPAEGFVEADDAVGQVFYTESRLKVQNTSLFLMVAAVSTMVVSTAVLYYLRPMTTSGEEVESLSALAAVLRRSAGLHDHVLALSASSEKDAKDRTAHNTFGSSVLSSGATAITVNTVQDESAAHQALQSPSATSKMNFHAPISLKVPVLLLTLLSAPVIIGVLECLQRRSDGSSNGLKTISNTAAFEVSALTRYIPGLIALLVATLYNTLAFNTFILANFNKMKNHYASHQDLSTTLLAQLPPVALYKSARRGYWAACLTGSGALVGSLLTVFASGLYAIEYVPVSADIEVALPETWNTSFHQGLATDNATAAVVSLLETVNLTNPLFTYEELVFPALSLPVAPNLEDTYASGLISVRVPALRAELVCTELGVDNSTGQAALDTGPVYVTMLFNTTVPLPEGCHLGSKYGNESFIQIDELSTRLQIPDNITYYAQYIDLHVGPWSGSFQETGTLYPGQPDNPPGCPSVLIAHAYFNGNDSSRSTITVLSCEQKIQRIETNLTLRTTDMSIPLDHPPVADEASAVYVNSGPNNETAFWWRLQAAIEDSLQLFNASAIDPYLLKYDKSGTVQDVSNFFRGALFGHTPLPLSYLEAEDQAGKDKLFEHLQQFYRRYMAQYISANMRVPVDRDPELLPATTISNDGVPCLKQNKTSKIILQSMLAFMFTCGTLAWAFNQYHDLVPWNPCTIMGVMVLFAGSKFSRPSRPDHIHGSASDRPNFINDMSQLEAERDHYEMTQLASQSQEDVKHGVGSEGHQALIQNDMDGPVGLNSSSDHRENLGRAQFRLGWWANGTFARPRPPAPTDDELAHGKLRYGIDIVD